MNGIDFAARSRSPAALIAGKPAPTATWLERGDPFGLVGAPGGLSDSELRIPLCAFEDL